jgi:hypothetical protein
MQTFSRGLPTNDQRTGQADKKVPVEAGLLLVEGGAKDSPTAVILVSLQIWRGNMPYTQAVVAISMIFASTTAAGQTTSASKDPPAKQASQGQSVKYCVETEPFTGSKISKTECKTKAEWATEGVNVDQLNKH